MPPLESSESEDAGCGSGCCRAATTHVENASKQSDDQLTSLTSTQNIEEQCNSDCYGNEEQEIVTSTTITAKNETDGCTSGCCSGSGNQAATKGSDNAFESAHCDSRTCDDLTFSSAPPFIEKELTKDDCAGGCCSTKPTSTSIGDPKTAHCDEACCGFTVTEATEDDCASGCCYTKPVLVTMKDSKPNNCNAGCCRTSSEALIQNNKGCRSAKPVTDTTKDSKADNCMDNCCGSMSEAPIEDCKDDCCGSMKPEQAQESKKCKDACCSSTNAPIISVNDCCDGKPNPCCTDDCVERLVIRECGTQCIERSAKGTKRKSYPSISSDEGEKCCPNGITARRFYRELLRSLGCLCATVKARGGESCCKPTPRVSRASKETSRSAHNNMQSDQINPANTEKVARSSFKANACAGDDDDDFCNAKPCAPGLEKKPPEPTVRGSPGLTPNHLEDGIADIQHVVLSVSGMTCVGCETNLQRSLASFKAVRNLKTSLTLCRAEFDFDRRYETLDSLIHQLQRKTEFKYEELKQNGSEIEVCPTNVKDFMHQVLPVGVFSLHVVDKTTVRISYNPSIVGARDLIEKGFGTPLTIAQIKPDPGLAAGSKHVRHVGVMTLLSAALTIPVLVLAWAPIHDRPLVYGGVSLALASLVQFVVAGPFYPAARKSLIFARMIEMDLLIVISTSAAYIFSVVAFGYVVSGKPLSTGEFFETSTLLVTLIMVGRWVSALARQKAVESVSVRSLQTPTGMLVVNNDTVREIDARLLQYGDIFHVAPESRVPTDGTVVTGVSEIDESMITGESLSVDKRPGKIVIAGSVNGSGALTVRLSRLPESNSISAIANMVDEAKLSKPRIQGVADKVASWFVPIAITLSLLVFLIWIPIGLRVRQYSGSRAVTEALTYAITVIVVSCPCAIGLAVPMVIVVAGGVAAKHGCIFKTASTIEIARKTSHVVFDKTGTLTHGQFSVAIEEYFESEQSVAAAVHALMSNIKHPVSIAVKKHLESKIRSKQEAIDVTSHVGKGIEGVVGGKVVKAGNSRWLSFDEHPAVRYFLSQGYTTLCASIDGNLVAIFGLQDSLRSDAKRTVAELQRRGIEVSIVSGDDEAPVIIAARQLGITSTHSKCSPADKLQFVKELTDAGKITIFCGDGTNDAAALAQATIGIHMNEGTDVAQSAADVVLIRSSLIDILTLIDLSKASMLRIAFNFGWSFVYNTLAILFASGALVNVRIPPKFAGLGELVSVLPVIAIAMQLRWAKFSQTPTTG